MLLDEVVEPGLAVGLRELVNGLPGRGSGFGAP